MKECNACGKCCVKYSDGGLSASKTEIQHWQDDHPDIFAHVHDGQIWADPTSKALLALCPFLQQQGNSKIYHCAIYDARPDDCRYYPSTLDEMIADDCEMLEPKDLKNPKQARITLIDIMRDSHYD